MNNLQILCIWFLIYLCVNLNLVQTARYCGRNGLGISTWCRGTEIPNCCGALRGGQSICCNEIPKNISKEPLHCGKTKALNSYYCVDNHLCCGTYPTTKQPFCCSKSLPIAESWYLWVGVIVFLIVVGTILRCYWIRRIYRKRQQSAQKQFQNPVEFELQKTLPTQSSAECVIGN